MRQRGALHPHAGPGQLGIWGSSCKAVSLARWPLGSNAATSCPSVPSLAEGPMGSRGCTRTGQGPLKTNSNNRPTEGAGHHHPADPLGDLGLARIAEAPPRGEGAGHRTASGDHGPGCPPRRTPAGPEASGWKGHAGKRTRKETLSWLMTLRTQAGVSALPCPLHALAVPAGGWAGAQAAAQTLLSALPPPASSPPGLARPENKQPTARAHGSPELPLDSSTAWGEGGANNTHAGVLLPPGNCLNSGGFPG